MKEILRMNEAQRIHSSFETPRKEKTILVQLRGFEEEAKELLEYLDKENLEEKIKDTDFAKEIGFEAVDCVMRCLGIIDYLGFDVERLFLEKMEDAYRKYPDKISAVRKNDQIRNS